MSTIFNSSDLLDVQTRNQTIEKLVKDVGKNTTRTLLALIAKNQRKVNAKYQVYAYTLPPFFQTNVLNEDNNRIYLACNAQSVSRNAGIYLGQLINGVVDANLLVSRINVTDFQTIQFMTAPTNAISLMNGSNQDVVISLFTASE